MFGYAQKTKALRFLENKICPTSHPTDFLTILTEAEPFLLELLTFTFALLFTKVKNNGSDYY
jgi:hypothetical protein